MLASARSARQTTSERRRLRTPGASRPPSPLLRRLAIVALAGGCQCACVSAIRWMAALSWRLSVRLSRRGMVRRPDRQRGGAVVAGVGVAALEAFDAGGFAEDLRRGE